MALVTVQRSPSPSQSRTDLDEGDGRASAEGSRIAGKQKRSRAASVVKRCFNSVRFLSRIRTSESYFTIKGAALILPNAEACKRKATKAAHGGDMQNHLQAMCRLLRPQDTLQVAVRLESVYAPQKRARYFAVVSCTGRQNTEESVVLGFDCMDDDTKTATVGLVLPIWANTCTSMNGDGGFTIRTANDRTANEKTHIFNPVTVQAMWSGLHVLHKLCDNANACCYVPSGLTHTWVSYYESKLALADPLAIGEWNMTDDVIAAVKSGEGNLACTPTVSEHEDIKKQIRPKLRDIMIRMDLEDLTSVYLREQLEAVLNRNLKEYKSFIDEEMIVVMGQLDSPSHIFDFLYLGSEWNASNLDELNRNGIGYILNVTKEIDNFFPGLFKYHNVRVHDTEDTDLLKYWEATHKFILRAVEANSRVLVHCKMGVSRSASTVIAFAMKQYNWSFEKAHDFVLARRSVVRPNDGFRHQLQLYEGILKASNQRHSDLWRSKSESNLKVQMHGTLSAMQLESHAECCPADEPELGNGDKSAAESSSFGMGPSARYRQSDASVPGALRPRSWSSRSMDRDQGGLTGTKSTSCLMELDSSLDEDDLDEDQSSSSCGDSSSDSGGSESDDGDAFCGAEIDSRQPSRHQQCYDVTACADSSASAHDGSTLAADCAASMPKSLEVVAESADPAAPTSPPAGDSVAAAAATRTRPRTLDISPRPPAVTSHSGDSNAQSESTSCRVQVSPVRIACSSRAAGLPVASTAGPHKAAESHAKSGSPPCGSTCAAKGSCTTAAPPSAVAPASAACAAVRGWVHPVQQQPRTPDTASSPGPARTSPCRGIGGSSRDMSPAKILVQELLGSSGSPSEELTVTGIDASSSDQTGLGNGAARPNTLEWIWKQRYAKEEIPWSPGAVRRQKDMLESVRARVLASSTAVGSTPAAAVTTLEAISATIGVPASLECALCPESDPGSANNVKTDDPCSAAATSPESYQLAPGTVKKVRREFEERLVGDDSGAARSCTVQRSSSLRGLPQPPLGRLLPATLQRSSSVRERRSVGCLCQASDDGVRGSSDAAGTNRSPRPVSAIVASPLPLLLSAARVDASLSSSDLHQHAGGSGTLAGERTVERAASLTCLTACPLPAGDSVKFFLGNRKAGCERQQPSGMHLADSYCTSSVNKQKQHAAGEPDAPLSASHLIMHHKTVNKPLRGHVAQELRDEATPHVSVQAWPVTMRPERGLRRCKSNSGSPSVVASKKVHGTVQYGGQELAVSPQLKHTSSVRNLVYIFEASWRNTWGVKEEQSTQHVPLAAGPAMSSSPQTIPSARSPGHALPLIRTQSFCLPCRRCTGDQRSPTNGGRLRAGHSSSRRPRIASAVFPTT